MTEHRIAVGGGIRRAREERGFSQAELAARVGKTQTTVSYWEAGRRPIDIDDLVALAQALDVDVGELFADANPQRSARTVFRAEAARLELDEVAAEVEEFADAAEALRARRPTFQISARGSLHVAQELLAAADTDRPPVNVIQLAKRCGVRTLGWPFSAAISGLLLDLETGPVIGYNDAQSRGRQRFTVAHELGHYLMRHHDNFHIDLASATAHGETADYSWKDERAANDFAAELLMPTPMVVEAAQQHEGVQRLAKLFDVSREAMGFRLINLGLR